MKWDYKTMSMRTKGLLGGKLDMEAIEGALNDLGRDGWQLVCAFDTNAAQGQSRDVIALFKRQR